MKHFMQPRHAILREHSSDTPPPNPSSMKNNRSGNRKHKSSKENAPPPSDNVIPDSKPSPNVGKLKSMLPPRPPSSNPLKRKIGTDFHPENAVGGSSDTGVKVIVRMRPLNNKEEGETVVQKTSGDSLTMLGHQFTFDHVADVSSTQIDIFELVGAPLVENCLAGFNSSIFAYGQTGSGKTYTIWGPTNTLLEENAYSNEQGLTSRVFARLFSRINEEQNTHADKQLTYQCRCSFLEIYNEQITDLLNPSQRNLHLREDNKTGVYVENLTEETICSMKDVTQLLKKGLSNRRTGSTSLNSESSRSHSVFTCVVESSCKSVDGLRCFKTSRMNLVDLAGSERQKSTGAAGERLKEAGNINRSLSQLGNLINILAEVSQTGKQRHIPYRDSKLTFLLQESLGGNAKLAMICAISPAQSCKNETFSTLRFAQRAKAIKNKAIVNEKLQNDVNTLREVIRQLKDELQRMKSTENQVDPNAGYSSGWNARRSINLLKFSLNRPMILPHVDDDGDAEMEIVEDSEPILDRKDSEDTDVNMQEDISDQAGNLEPTAVQILENNEDNKDSVKDASTNLPVESSEASPVLKSPTLSISPIPINSSRKSLRTSSMLTASQKDHLEKNVPKSFNDHLSASLHRGLDVLNKQRKSCAFKQSSFTFSYKPLDNKPLFVKKDAGVQAVVLQGNELEEKEKPVLFLCRNCKCTSSQDVKEGIDSSNLQLVPVEGSLQSADKNKQMVPKSVEKVLAGAIRREMALEELCARQDSEINQLNRLLQQYKHERECNLIIGEIRDDKIARLESLMDGILSAEEFKDKELVSLKNENKMLKENYESHPEVLRTEIEFQRFQDELERYQNFFDLGERDVLLEEIEDLKTQLQLYIDSSSKRTNVLQLTYQSDPSAVEAESKWASLVQDLELKLHESRLLVEKQKHELETERKCAKELKDAMQMAMEGHARMLEQYADLEEKHINLLTTQRRIEDGIIDVKKAAAKAGVKGAESKFINALAEEISILKAENEKERRYYRDESNGLKAQLKDTDEAVVAAGELLVRLKEAEDAVAAAEARTRQAEEEREKAYKEIEKLKKKLGTQVSNMPKYERDSTNADPQWKDEIHNFYDEDGEVTKLSEPSSWLSGYDTCNI
ncbi:putative plus-end-directed kinesin ATPase [Helianthus annuus]|nr:putative plus-end-directed kinesin ATPase [Helianthus annuus]